MKSVLKKIAPFISVVFFGLAVWFLEGKLRQYELQEVINYTSQIAPIYIISSLILCALSYLLLTGYDALGVEYIGEDLALGKTMRAGFIGYAFSHNIGMALITGGSIRYRLYSAWGLTGLQVTKIVGFSAFTLWIGFCSTAGLSLILYSPQLPKDLIPYVSLTVLGIVLLVMVIAYMAASAMVKDELSFKNWSFDFPGFTMAVKQVVIASVDWLLAASVLFVLLPEVGIPFFGFVGVFLLAQIVGLFSQVPGGLGVFESIIVLYLSNFIDTSSVLGILLVYRIIYYLIPLIFAMGLLGHQEYTANREVVKEFGSKTAEWFPRIVPLIFSIVIFIGGTVLLFSGAVPSEVPRMQWLQPLVPLPVIEMSHFFASLVGAVLLVLARGLQQRIDAAWHATVGMLIFGIIFSLLKGVSYVEAAILTAMLIALIPAKSEFHRKASLFSQSFSPLWVTLILMVIVSSVWLGLFSYRNVQYQEELWWQFTLLGDAPRYIRASVGVLGLAFIFGLISLFRPSKSKSDTDDSAMYSATKMAKRSKRAQSNLLLLDDKNILLSENKNAFIMYGVEENSWISMGDPLGAEGEVEELIWEFRETSHRNDGWPVFYQVHDRYLELYRNLSLTVLKLGEEARLALKDFNISDELRHKRDKFTKQGYRFEVIPAKKVPQILGNLRSVSDQWLSIPGNHEKRFSLGHFTESYVQNFPVAVVRNKNTIIGFANFWSSAQKHEISCDMIRFRPDAPPELVDFMLIELGQWAKKRNYKWFNMGLAPLSEMNEADLEPRWAKFSNQLFSYDEHFYNFQGVRTQKQQFNPQWEPIYLAAPAGLKLPTVLSNLSEIISGHRRKR